MDFGPIWFDIRLTIFGNLDDRAVSRKYFGSTNTSLKFRQVDSCNESAGCYFGLKTLGRINALPNCRVGEQINI